MATTIDLKKCVLTIQDGTGTPNTLNVSLGSGNLTWTERRNMDYILSQGALDTVREGDEVPIDVSFDFKWDYVTATTVPSVAVTPYEALTNTGGASAWLSSDTADACAPYAVNLIFVHTPTPSTCGDIETYTLSNFRYEEISFDASAGTVSCRGKCKITKGTYDATTQ